MSMIAGETRVEIISSNEYRQVDTHILDNPDRHCQQASKEVMHENYSQTGKSSSSILSKLECSEPWQPLTF